MRLAILDISGDVAFTLLGAVVVAVFTGLLTAHTTNKRQERQLRHDRIETDRAELRDALDGATAAAIEAMRALARASHAIDPTLYETTDRAVLEEQRRYSRDRVQAGLRAVGELTPHLGRLQLRIGGRHDVVAMYRVLTDRGNEVTDQIPETLPGTPQQTRDADTLVHRYAADMENFIEAAHALIGTSDAALERSDAPQP